MELLCGLEGSALPLQKQNAWGNAYTFCGTVIFESAEAYQLVHTHPLALQ